MRAVDRKNNMINYLKSNKENIIKQKELIERQEKYIDNKIETLNNIDLFTKEETKEIIEYLVGKIEGSKYSVEKYYMDVKTSSYRTENLVTQYTFLYLVNDDNKENAKEEIINKYDIEVDNDVNYLSSKNMVKDDISENYVKLAFYNRHSDRVVKFEHSQEPHVISIDIKDNKFNYIYDFVEELINARLDRHNFSLDIEGSKIIADNFALKYKHKKKLVLESE